MTSKLRVILEIGTKGRRVVAAATDWPGLDRWGKTEDDALEKLSAYIPRYVGVAERADLADDFERQRTIEVVERYPGSSSTDFWGIAHVPSEIERDVLSPTDLDRRIDLLRASWATSTTSRHTFPQSCARNPVAVDAAAIPSSATRTAPSPRTGPRRSV